MKTLQSKGFLVCGRFTLRTHSSAWCQMFLPEMDPGHSANMDDPPRYNIAPTQAIATVICESAGDPRQAVKMRWGLVPSWADDLSIGNRMINARGETVDSKPSFRRSFASRRCLIPADGYFEWKKMSDGKQPYLIERSDHGVFAIAGLWDENRKATDNGSPIRSCTVITTSANRVTADIHDRMPVILDTADHEVWLDPGFRDTDRLKSLLRPAPDELLRLTAVSRRVNSPKYDDAQCVVPV